MIAGTGILRFSQAQAKRFLLMKQGLLGKHRFSGQAGVMECVRQLSCIQFDPLDICGRNDSLLLHSRVDGYRPAMLDALLYTERSLFDYWDKNLSICVTEDWPCFEATRNQFRERGVRSQDQIAKVADQVLDLIDTKGPLCAQDLPCDTRVDWWWSPTSLSRAVLETLYFQGTLMIHHKQGTRKYYELTSRLLPPHLLQKTEPFATHAERLGWQLRRRIGAVGLLWRRSSPAFLGMVEFKKLVREKIFAELMEAGELVEVRVEGIEEPLYMLATDLPLVDTLDDDPGIVRTEFLAPLDSLLWDRALVERLFGFDYTWEVYAPQAKRKFGYYVLPVLHGEELIGRVEPVRNRKTGLLEIRGCWFEPAVVDVQEKRAAIARTAMRLALMNGCDRITLPW
ncbi:MAG: winged helix-turn-helix domain-containing protein [Spirochaetae bacterium HGW-Spirochaetae-8]|nr:MAG: winged helix-turn-helix domain-containing protein [Spirochaetae bacterium HGW-Spirochaetae-8]